MKNKDTFKLDELRFWFDLEFESEEEEEEDEEAFYRLEIYDNSGTIVFLDIPDDFSTESEVTEATLRAFAKWLNSEADTKKVEVI